ncbi:MAG: biotin--[acetyl-CoA-carboxylase] ligase [Hamadaea sp.]|uniref:biotin--[acetyl-CoA-carboxylase] ligase n=1 Tax=Hamadaea sp. TaxID=2024425 RepID=UPI0017CBDEA1|nr:biotin--[acetyl-CoA-carboxylase] ligase [Hamadaea sp.]NUR72264.1 biotin--[acetyl-CoA-carboxylase] ligase [Hamadaea sp.]NUT23220.1 biotin--[acetyl-CoA-carboxylase] ligase [Hamadaea sp.]
MKFLVREVRETGSTNADVLAAAQAGEPEGLVVSAGTQTAGRGRLGRTWQSPPGGGLWFSVLLRPADVPPARLGWLPLLAGVALAHTVREVAGVPTELKWPNDLLVGGKKCAGILAEATGTGAIALGIGLNTRLTEEQLPPPPPSGLPPTSLTLSGGSTVDNNALLHGLLDRLDDAYAVWRAAGGDAEACGLRSAYQQICATIGLDVRAILPGGAEVRGRATTVDSEGRLVVAGQAVAAGDIVHLRADTQAMPRTGR